MSPGPPLQPIYPRNTLVSPSATMAESPHPIHSTTAFPLHQLPPPPIQFRNPPATIPPSFSGHHLAPLAIASPGNAAAGLLPRQHTARQQPSHLPQQHHVPPQLSSVSVSHQQPPSQLRADGRETSTSCRLLSSQPTFPQYTTPPYDSGYDPRFNQRPNDRRKYYSFILEFRMKRTHSAK